jgi:hypothetical protein
MQKSRVTQAELENVMAWSSLFLFLSPVPVHVQKIYSCLSKPACLNVRMSQDLN